MGVMEAWQNFTAFESYMLTDDHADYPMCFFVDTVVRGPLDRARLTSAIEQTLPRHPLLSCVAARQGRRQHWQPISTRPVVDDISQREPAIDLAASPGLRVLIGTDEASGVRRIRWQFHHSATDAIGATGFIEDVLGKYDALFHGNPSSPPPLPPLASRELELSWRAAFGRNRHDFLRIWRFFANQPLEIQSTTPSATAAAPYPAVCSRTIATTTCCAYQQQARQMGGTVNDLLLRDLYVTLHDWMLPARNARNAGVLRICVPLNLRNPRELAVRGENCVSMVFLDRSLRVIAAEAKMADAKLAGSAESATPLLLGIHDEMRQVKRDRMGLAFLRAVGWLQRIPGELRRVTAIRRYTATAVLSNLGRVWSGSPLEGVDGRLTAGNLTIESLELLPPVRRATPVAIGVATYANQLHLALHYDARVINANAAQTLLNRLAARIASAMPSTVPQSVER